MAPLVSVGTVKVIRLPPLSLRLHLCIGFQNLYLNNFMYSVVEELFQFSQGYFFSVVAAVSLCRFKH